MNKKGRKRYRKEEDSEEWCFVCKDGGDLIMCDHKDCVKSYHLECVQLDDSAAKSKCRFICGLHKCEDCGRTSDIHCYGCPRGLCRRCINSADFVHVNGNKGFCSHCLKLTLLVEEKKDVASDGETIDFNNRNTYETLYKEYWEIINVTEKVTLEVLVSAKAQLKLGMNYDSDKYDDTNEYQRSDSEDMDHDVKSHDVGKKVKRSKPEPSVKKRKKKGKNKENKQGFSGWASTPLIHFLNYIGKDTPNALSQRDLEKIIKGYSKDNNLILNNKKVQCDVWLQSIFRKKTVKLNRIYDFLETHLTENQGSSDDDELGYCSDHDDEELVVKKRNKKNTDKTVEKEDMGFDRRLHFAAIVPENVKLVYLRRSLVQKFEKEPETFESKVIGSFVRVKEDKFDCFSMTSYQLMQVTGVKKCLDDENNQTFVLQSLEMDIRTNSLSDDDFSEVECMDLKNKVKSGLLKKLKLVELEEKARILHKDIVAHWIPRELAVLKHRIDQANEKGWRKELFEYLERRQFLQNPTNQSMLLEKVPTVVPDIEEVGPLEDDKDSPKSILMHTPSGNFEENTIISEERKGEVPASEKYAMALELEKFFGVQDKSKRASIVKNPTQLFDSCDINQEDLKDTESSRWYVTSPGGEKVGPVSLSVLKNWSQTQGASDSKIYKATQSEEEAKSLTAVLHLAFSRK